MRVYKKFEKIIFILQSIFMKNNILRILAAIVLLTGIASCGGDYYLKRGKFYHYKKHWHRRWARPGRHYGTGYY